MPPLYPDKDIAARDLWPPKEGRNILQEIAGKDVQIAEPEEGSWLLAVGQEWRLFSSRDDLCSNHNIARQRLFDAVKMQQQLEPHLSPQRCLAVTETGESGQWRLWQIIKNESSLRSLLEKPQIKDDSKKMAAMLFIVADKFLETFRRFSEAEIALPLTLENLSLNDSGIIFSGFFLTSGHNQDLELEKTMVRAFEQLIGEISANPVLDNAQILQCLAAHASENANHTILMDVLSKLFRQ